MSLKIEISDNSKTFLAYICYFAKNHNWTEFNRSIHKDFDKCIEELERFGLVSPSPSRDNYTITQVGFAFYGDLIRN